MAECYEDRALPEQSNFLTMLLISSSNNNGLRGYGYGLVRRNYDVELINGKQC
jgi:hypothetical protein